MKKIYVTLFISCVLLLSGCSAIPVRVSPDVSAEPSPSFSASAQPTAPASAEEPNTTPATAAGYFPYKENVHMTYKGTGNEYAGFETYVDYINNGAIQIRTNNGGTEIVSVYLIDDGALKKVYKSPEETYFRYDFTAQRTPPEILLMEPLAVGTTWTLESGAQRSITATDAAVTVPYGSFKALEVTTTDTGSTIKEYYVLGVGLVKRVFTFNDNSSAPVTSELENFEEGSPLNQNARFYYPDFNNNRVAYIDKTLEFYTGDNVTSKFEYEFKHIPSGSALSHVMSEAATLNSITFDMLTGVVTADFSKQFITGMNAGTTLEGMILSSVADTLGNYFQTDKVQITIDGGPYESGHFLFNTGDYLPLDSDKAVAYNP